MTRKLSAVPDDAVAPPAKPKPKNIKAAVELEERDLLAAMRTKVAEEIDAGVPAHALAPLVRQLRDLDKDIRALDARAAEEGSQGAAVADESFDSSAI